jgi:hypothetical protein
VSLCHLDVPVGDGGLHYRAIIRLRCLFQYLARWSFFQHRETWNFLEFLVLHSDPEHALKQGKFSIDRAVRRAVLLPFFSTGPEILRCNGRDTPALKIGIEVNDLVQPPAFVQPRPAIDLTRQTCQRLGQVAAGIAPLPRAPRITYENLRDALLADCKGQTSALAVVSQPGGTARAVRWKPLKSGARRAASKRVA